MQFNRVPFARQENTIMKRLPILLIAIGCLQFVLSSYAQVPSLINYQGRIVDNGTNFDGTGQFEFALVNPGGTTNYWSNDGTAAGQPAAAVSLTVTKGLYSVLLGDTTIPNMTVAVPSAVFANSNVLLRVWFNDGVTGFQQLSPDQRLAAIGYAMMAGNVPDGAITSNQLAAGAVGTTQLAAGAVNASALAPGAVGSAQLAAGVVQTSNIASGAVTEAQISASGILVPNLNADLLDGLNSSAFIQNGGTISGGTISVVKQVLHYSVGPITYNQGNPYTYNVSICCSPNPAKCHVTLSVTSYTIGAIVTSFSSSSISIMTLNPSNQDNGVYVGVEILEYY
jgi:hypothetical protein